MRERAITFKAVQIESGKILRNVETNVEIYQAGNWYVDYPIFNPTMASWTNGPFYSQAEARVEALRLARSIRTEVARVHALHA